MSQSFDPQRGLIVVPVELFGLTGSIVVRCALDTGATRTMISVAMLVTVGYDPSLEPERVQVTTGSGVEFSPLTAVTRIVAIGQERIGLPVLAHTLPPTAGIDGLLGLDFLRERLLEIDFRKGMLSLS